jgi:hypothetical protein
MTDTAVELNGHPDVLTPLQRRFVEFALDCGSSVEAYRRAGGRATTDESAWQQASALMRNREVSAAIASLRAERARLLVADSAWLREKLVLIVNRALQAVPVYDSQGNETGAWKCDYAAANAAARTLALLNAKDPPPADGPGEREALYARLRMMGIDPEKHKQLSGGNGPGYTPPHS